MANAVGRSVLVLIALFSAGWTAFFLSSSTKFSTGWTDPQGMKRGGDLVPW
jgi:hypothetical protein